MKLSLRALLCLLLTLLTFSVYPQSYEKDFDSLLTAQFPKGGPGGVALVARKGEVLYKKAFGQANLELKIPMHTNQVFRIGSNTKQFTAVAILKLAQEGKFALKDDITKFIKDYPTKGKTITIENLLSHTSGIKNYTGISKWNQEVMRKDFSPKALVDFFKDEPMDFDPGTDYRYDNSGYVILGYIIELVTGKSYAQYIQESFFQPLGMQNSFYDESLKIISNRASGYKKRNNQYENSAFLSTTLPYAAGALLSTVDDFYTWYKSLADLKVINKESLEEAQTSYRLKNGRLTGYGYGWEIGNVQGVKSVKHVGVVNGFVTYGAYIPSDEIFIAIFSNCECAGDLNYPASKMAGILLNKPYDYKMIRLSTEELIKYQAIYKTENEGSKVISLQDNELYYYNKGGSKSKLLPYAKDKFYIENTLLNMVFERNSKKDIIGFNLKGTGLPLSGDRTNEYVPEIKSIKISEELLDKYVGKYQFEKSFLFEVIKEDNKLFGQVGNDKKELVSFEKNKFFVRDLDTTIIFNLDTDGRVLGLTKIQNSEMKAKKI